MKHIFLPIVLLSALACSTPESKSDAGRADAVAAVELPLVRYYVIGDT